MRFESFLLLITLAVLAQCHADVIFERIKNGQVVSGEDFSFTARIDLNGKQVCNGVLVNTGWVATEKSCIDKGKLASYLISFSSFGSNDVDVIRAITNVKTADKKNNEIILLQLNDTILGAEDKVKPLSRFSSNKLDKKMKSCKAIGFSENGQKLVELTVGLKKTSKCRKASSKKNICFDAKKGSLCKVDNGSPVVCKYKTKWYLVGTALVTKGCSNTNVQGALISFYVKAIQKVLNDKNNIDCGSVPRIENGRAKLTGGSTKFGSKASVSCDLNYKTDKKVIQCQRSGRWETSTCIKNGCGPPPKVAFAKVILKDGSTKTGSLAEVKCFRGYETNSTILTCKPSGDWQTTTCEVKEKFDNRLPNALNPLKYELELQPDIYNTTPSFNFTGYVSILIECINDTSTIILNMNDLSIEGEIEVMDSLEDIYEGYEYDSKNQFLYIQTKRSLTASNNYSMHIKFSGELKDISNGLYYGYEARGSNKVYVASQLEPISAREIFPCFDEPVFKSTFDVTLVRKEPMRSLSNMPIMQSEKRDDGWIADTFSRTPVMSTYLLAFVVCDFDYLEENTTNGLPFRTFSTPEYVNYTQYSLDAGVKMMPFFEDYFNYPYTLPKADMIAVPKFSAAAMENWGLIVYRDYIMLVETDNPTYNDRLDAAATVGHELAHMWFGNLVTLNWWTELWLNEGFAKYFEYIAVDILHPEWKMDDMFIKYSLQEAFNEDSDAYAHPLNNPVSKPDEITVDIFDRITYHKGAAIVRMLRFVVGDNTFQKGLQKYLKNLQYKTATKDDLWAAMQEQAIADKNSITNIKGIMDTWVLQNNYPVVKVEFSEEGKITLTQKRFNKRPDISGPKEFESPYGHKWNIPFAYVTSSSNKFDVSEKDITVMRLGKDEVTIKDKSIPKPKGNKWVLGNPNQYGYFRVNYDNRNWNALADQLVSDHTVFPVSNRAQLIEDVWELYSTGDQRLSIALRFFEYLDKERNWLPWGSASDEFRRIGYKLDSNAIFQRYKKFMRAKLKDVYVELIQKTDYTFSESRLVDNIKDNSCRYGLSACVNNAKQDLAEWKADPENLSGEDFTTRAYCSAIAAGSQSDWEFVLEQFNKNPTKNQRRALLCTKNPSNIDVLFQLILNGNISVPNSFYIISDLTSNPVYRIRTWEFLNTEFDNLLKVFYGNMEFMRVLVDICSQLLSTVEELNLVKKLKESRTPDFKKHPTLEKTFDTSIKYINENIDWITNNVQTVDKWLSNQGY